MLCYKIRIAKKSIYKIPGARAILCHCSLPLSINRRLYLVAASIYESLPLSLPLSIRRLCKKKDRYHYHQRVSISFIRHPICAPLSPIMFIMPWNVCREMQLILMLFRHRTVFKTLSLQSVNLHRQWCAVKLANWCWTRSFVNALTWTWR